MKITLRLNDHKRTVEVPPMKRLLDTLREDFGLTGTKEGCGEGECGACTVLLDGVAVNSCLVPSCQADGHEVTTIEGLGTSGKLDRLQQAFLECGASQCGICTPGMIVAASALPRRPTLDQIRDGLAGNLCRCTGYVKIYAAVQQALGDGDARKAEKARKKAKKAAKPAKVKKEAKPAKAKKEAKPVKAKKEAKPPKTRRKEKPVATVAARSTPRRTSKPTTRRAPTGGKPNPKTTRSREVTP